MKVGFVTLGCDKNTVDSERYLARLAGYGAVLTHDMEEAELILVNTCGFIDAAKKESIDAIVEAGRMKREGSCQAVVAVGCMVERHKSELADALPEVDLFLGASEGDRLVPELESRGLLGPEDLANHPGVRIYAGDLRHVRYLKISEGCDHGCAFCAIPLMRGKHRSFGLDEVIREAQLLELDGTKELNLVAQDLAHYGRDRRDGNGLPELLQSLAAETDIPWIRMLYLYSAGITPKLIDVIAREPRILRYLDMPMQHASDTVLSRMRRPERKKSIRERVQHLREAVPELAIRTTCIVGFPGETEDDFDQLLEFLEEIRFDRVGAFTYSPQEGTRAAELPDDVPDTLKRERMERLTELQRAITAERYEQRTGTRSAAIVDRVSPEGVQARLPWQADDIDGVTWLSGSLAPGTIVDVTVEAVVEDYDFRAAVIGPGTQLPRTGPERRPRPRSLPLAAAGIGSYGR